MLQDRKPDGHLILTQEGIARTLGVQRPTITNIAHTLREDGVIDYVRGRILITDREKLDDFSCLCQKNAIY
jgi:Mn-dependent DtxR family transcriptional regulator